MDLSKPTSADKDRQDGEGRQERPARSARSGSVNVGSSSRVSTRRPATPDEINELARLWEEFKQNEVSGAREGARERLILHYAPLVKYVASRVATGLPASVDQADLVSYGMFGLIDALEKFDPGRGNKFETYAIPRIKGAIIDELRAMDWVPRSVRFKAREIEKAYSDLESIHKRGPTEKEVAARLGVTLRELHDVINQISFVQVLQLDEILSVGSDRGEQVSLLDTLADRGTGPDDGARGRGDARTARGGDQLAVRTREDRRHPVLLRGTHPRRDRRHPRGDGIAGLPDPHEGGRSAPAAARRDRVNRSPLM